MVVPIGAMVNAGAAALGAAAGLCLGGLIPERVRVIVFQLFGLFMAPIGLGMTGKSPDLILALVCVIVGGGLGEALNLSRRLDGLAGRLKLTLRSENPQFTEGLVSSSIMVCVGAMAIIGSLEEGLGQGRTTVYTKSLIDFFAVAVLASRLGSGVVLCAVPLLIYQGLMTVAAGALQPLLTEPTVNCLSAAGGIMIMGLGVNMIGFKPQVRVSSVLPALPLALALPALFG